MKSKRIIRIRVWNFSRKEKIMRKNKVRYLVIAALVGSFQTAAVAQQKAPAAKPGLVSVAILPVEVKGLDPSLGTSIGGAVASQLEKTGVLKVPTTKAATDTFNQLQKRKTQLETCSNRPWCIQTVAKAFNAKVVYYATAAKAQDGVTLTMRIFDAKTGKEMRKAVEFSTEDVSEIERAARWASLTVSSPVISSLTKGKGKLLVECSEGGSDLSINGKSFGKKTGKSFKVSAGVFDVTVRKDGFVSYRSVVMINPEEEQVIKATLISEASKAVAAAPTKSSAVRSPGEAPPPLSAESSKEQPRKNDLPAWALFETPKETGRVGQPAFAKKPEVEKAAEEPPKEGKKKFYKTWWFWTVVGVAVVGGVTAGLILGLPKDETATGSATITWR
jgi:PEGA domain.